jgi:two-component system alkaline phosphatase synthesis response regulator PhoP
VATSLFIQILLSKYQPLGGADVSFGTHSFAPPGGLSSHALSTKQAKAPFSTKSLHDPYQFQPLSTFSPEYAAIIGTMIKQRILVVDDDKEIVRLLRGYLEKSGFEVLVAYDGETAVHTLRRERPDLVVLDLMLPDMDGWDITRTVRSDNSLMATPIIMLTARVEDTDKIIGLELGADDYVTKPFNPAEVIARVRAQLRAKQRNTQGSSLPTSEIFEVSQITLDLGKRDVTIEGKAVELTPTEFNLLHIMIENPGYVFTRSELIERSLGHEYLGMDRTLDSHIKNLRRKIEPDPKKPTYILTVYGIGYRLAEL